MPEVDNCPTVRLSDCIPKEEEEKDDDDGQEDGEAPFAIPSRSCPLSSTTALPETGLFSVLTSTLSAKPVAKVEAVSARWVVSCPPPD